MEDHGSVIRACKESIFAVGTILCGFKDFDQLLHGSVDEWIRGNIKKGNNKLLVMWPRDHYKTSLVTIAGSIWFIINNPEVRILLIQKTGTKASEVLRAIAQHMTGDMFRHYFGDLLPDIKKARWNQNEIEVQRRGVFPEPTISARGVDSAVVGGHYDVEILDDMVDSEATDSVAQMDSVIRFHKRANFLFDSFRRGVRITVGTFWPGGFYEQAVESTVYEKIILGCFVDSRFRAFLASVGKECPYEDGEPIFPSEFTTKELEAIRDDPLEGGPVEFSHQMLNVAVTEGMRRFDPANFRYYVPMDAQWESFNTDMGKIRRADLYVTMVVDPSTGEGKDESAITVCGWEREKGIAIVLEAWSDRVLIDKLVDQIFYLARKWKPNLVGMEDVAFQKTLRQIVVNEMLRRKMPLSIDRSIKPHGQSKNARIVDSLQPFIATNKVYFVKNTQKKLMTQMERWLPNKKDQPDDLVDCLAYQTRYWSLIEVGSTDQDDLEYWESDESVREEPAYGLVCRT